MVKRIEQMILKLAQTVYWQVQRIKQVLVIRKLERKHDQNIARLGEEIFKKNLMDFSLLARDAVLSAQTEKILAEQRALASLKKENLT